MTTETIRVVLDAAYDLSQAGYSRDEASDFTAAYRGCLKHIAERSGLDIRLVTVGDCYTGPDTHEAGSNADDHGLWQSIHDCVKREDGEGWVWYEEDANAVASRLSANDEGE